MPKVNLLEQLKQNLFLIHAPPAGDRYEVLKECPTTLYSMNHYQRFEALVSLPLTGDQKPSHLMNRMLVLLSDNYKRDFILWGLFLSHLPIEVCSHLLQEKILDPRALVLKADELFQSRVSSPVNLFSPLFLWLRLFLRLKDVLICCHSPPRSLLFLSTWRRRFVLRFLFLLLIFAGILIRRFEVFRLSPPSSDLSFWGEYLQSGYYKDLCSLLYS